MRREKGTGFRFGAALAAYDDTRLLVGAPSSPFGAGAAYLIDSNTGGALQTFNGTTALSFGGAFNQEFQGLDHSNAATVNMVSGVNTNQLITVGHGFNNAVANLNVNAQLAPGIQL